MHSLKYQLEQMAHDALTVIISTTVNIVKGIYGICNILSSKN